MNANQKRGFLADNIRRAPSVSSVSSASSIAVLPTSGDVAAGKDFDSVSVESCGLSPIALQNIREQMALSLQRTRQLEDQITIIPSLQVGIRLLACALLGNLIFVFARRNYLL